MKKKEKVKPRTQILGSNLKERTFNYYIRETEADTRKFNESLFNKTNLDNVDFYLFQSISNEDKMRDMLFELAYFYDTNFTGNRDFIHIPNISTITDNAVHYPMILATKKDELGNDAIIGATTIKMENNSSISDNPYFPTKNENVLSITGVLSSCDATFRDGSRVRGVGKQLFKSAIKGAYEINKNENIRLICEIDCRNKNSMNSVSNAVRELNDEGIDVQLGIVGYYEILDKKNKMVEAPTFVLEIDLSGEKDINHQEKVFNFNGCGTAYNELNEELLEVIRNNTKEYRRFINSKEGNMIVYHRIKAIDALKVTLKTGDTVEGNERVPVLQSINVEYA